MVEPHQTGEGVFIHGLMQVAANGGPIGNGLGGGPGLKGETQGVHVRVGAHPGVAEQIPGAAHGPTRFKHDHLELRALLAKVHRCAYAGDACAYDDNIYRIHGFLHLRLNRTVAKPSMPPGLPRRDRLALAAWYGKA